MIILHEHMQTTCVYMYMCWTYMFNFDYLDHTIDVLIKCIPNCVAHNQSVYKYTFGSRWPAHYLEGRVTIRAKIEGVERWLAVQPTFSVHQNDVLQASLHGTLHVQQFSSSDEHCTCMSQFRFNQNAQVSQETLSHLKKSWEQEYPPPPTPLDHISQKMSPQTLFPRKIALWECLAFITLAE